MREKDKDKGENKVKKTKESMFSLCRPGCR